MKYKNFLYITLIFKILLFSCEKEIEFKGNEMKTMLVLNGLLMPDSIVTINLTESRFFLDDGLSFKKINNATVELWKDGIKIENLLNTEGGNYIGTYIPKVGDKLLITASCDGFESIECYTEIVIPTPILCVDTLTIDEMRYYYYQNENGVISVTDSSSYFLIINSELKITFNDPKDIPNYYMLKIYWRYFFSDGDSLDLIVRYKTEDLIFQSRNKISPFENEEYLRSTLFNDELFDGKEYTLKINADQYVGIFVGKDPFNPDGHFFDIIKKELFVDLQSLSYPYYMYLKTRESQSNLDGVMEYFGEPAQIYSNVKGGTGILGNYSSYRLCILF